MHPSSPRKAVERLPLVMCPYRNTCLYACVFVFNCIIPIAYYICQWKTSPSSLTTPLVELYQPCVAAVIQQEGYLSFRRQRIMASNIQHEWLPIMAKCILRCISPSNVYSTFFHCIGYWMYWCHPQVAVCSLHTLGGWNLYTDDENIIGMQKMEPLMLTPWQHAVVHETSRWHSVVTNDLMELQKRPEASTGVAVQILAEEPSAVLIHCDRHALNCCWCHKVAWVCCGG